MRSTTAAAEVTFDPQMAWRWLHRKNIIRKDFILLASELAHNWLPSQLVYLQWWMPKRDIGKRRLLLKLIVQLGVRA
jgi:hypothetical protein